MSKNWLKALNPEQLKAVSFGQGPLLILAGAGSGKTRALTYRAAYLIKEKGVLASKILLVTFTNKAAKEMKERIKKLVAKKSVLPWTGTFHSWCSQLLRKEGKQIGISSKYLINDEEDSLGLIKQAMDNLKIDKKKFKPSGVKAVISQVKNELIGPLEYQELAKGEFYTMVAKVYLEYQRLLKKYEGLDFDDLLMEVVKLLTKVKSVREKYSQQYEYVLVDEYQDTNKAQYQLAKMLAGKWRNLTAVGDFSQSIYSFRGADFRNLNNLKADFPDLAVVNLEQNYRSTKNILEAANKVISKNTSHPILGLWTKAQKGEKLMVFEAGTEKEEAGFICQMIKTSGVKLDETAVLYRTNAQSRVLEEAMIKTGIPYALVGGIRFYSRKEIKDLLAYVRLYFNPKDMVSWERVVKLGKRRLDSFSEWSEKNQLMKEKWQTVKILDEVLKTTGYLQLFDENDEQDLMRLENIKELKSVGREYKELEAFLENVALIEQTDLSLSRSNIRTMKGKVTLMTLHASKGLEFKLVFMVGMEEGLFPHSRSMMDKEELEEERRLCYVGMTRAKEKLCLSYARRRLYFGSLSNNMVSRFLLDIDKDLIEMIGGNASWDDMINLDDY